MLIILLIYLDLTSDVPSLYLGIYDLLSSSLYDFSNFSQQLTILKFILNVKIGDSKVFICLQKSNWIKLKMRVFFNFMRLDSWHIFKKGSIKINSLKTAKISFNIPICRKYRRIDIVVEIRPQPLLKIW